MKKEEVIVWKEKPCTELRELDCNCGDCKHLIRSLSKRQKHVDFHYQMQKNSFNVKRIKLLEKGEYHLRRAKNETEKAIYYKDKAKNNFKEARKMQFVFDEGSCSLGYGKCSKFDKEVSFIPQTLQLHTQNCFEIR